MSNLTPETVVDALRRGDRLAFRDGMRSLLAGNANLSTGWRSLAEPLLRFGEYDLACAAIERYARSAPRSPAVPIEVAAVFARAARPDKALRILEQAPRNTPDPATNLYLRGTLALNLGNLADARENLLGALSVRPGSGEIAYTLAKAVSLADDVEVCKAIMDGERLLDRMPASDRVLYSYALGKTFEDLNLPDRAIASFRHGAELAAVDRRYVVAQDRASAISATHGWTRDLVKMVGDQISIETSRPVIVTGMPRSGTTLVEQILTSHSDFSGGDEVGAFGHVLTDIGGPDGRVARRIATNADANRPAREYLYLLRQRFGEDGRVVDKTLEASRYLGTLAAVMPGAPLLWVRRNALARAWSCYSTYFMAGLNWTYSRKAIAEHTHLEDSLLCHWQEILGDRLMVVDYEALVTRPAPVVDAICAHCGLTQDNAMLSPHASTRLVRTASVAQVRKPINASREILGEAYKAFMQPFVEHYERLGSS